jgi:DNA-binding transcriptional ArsR family regulator
MRIVRRAIVETNRTDRRAHDYVPVVELDRATLRVAVSPLPTAFTLTRDALQDGRLGTPSAWRKSIVSHLRVRDTEAFAPLTAPDTTGWPTLLDDVPVGSETLDEALQRLAATPGSALLEALESDRDVTVTRAWHPLQRDPDRWLRGYVDTLHRAWRSVESLWRRSSALFERETERIGAAIDQGVSNAQIADQLHPRSSLVDGRWRLTAGREPRRLGMGEHGLTVTPMIAGQRTCFLASPGDFCVRLAYSLPDAWRAFDDQAPPPASLHALVGRQRAALLRRLDDPHAAGRLAELTHLTPGAITFHLRALEAAGLITRVRQGRRVIVHRTGRGTQLLALYEPR